MIAPITFFPLHIDWVFFDVGNTLMREGKARIDRDRQLLSAIRRHRPSVTAADLEKAISHSWRMGVDKPIENSVKLLLGSDDSEIAKTIASAIRYRSELERPFPHTASFLKALSRRYRLGVIANQTPGLKDRLHTCGLGKYFSAWSISAELGIAKPDRQLFLHALAQSGCPADRAAMVGDRLDNDIKPARALGMWTTRLLQGPARWQAPKENAERADRTIRSLKEIIDPLSSNGSTVVRNTDFFNFASPPCSRAELHLSQIR